MVCHIMLKAQPFLNTALKPESICGCSITYLVDLGPSEIQKVTEAFFQLQYLIICKTFKQK